MCDDDNMTFVIITTMYVIARPSSLVTIIIITSKTVWCDKRVVIHRCIYIDRALQSDVYCMMLAHVGARECS